MKFHFLVRNPANAKNLVAREFPFFSRTTIEKLFRKKEIKIGGHVILPSEKVLTGEGLTVFLPDPRKNFRVLTGCQIIFEDDDVVVFDKKSGMTTHAGVGTHGKTLHEAAEKLLDLKLTVVHRLDRDTSGVIVFAKNSAAARRLEEEFKKRRAQKTYLAVVDGVPKVSEGVIDFPLAKSGEKMKIVKSGGLSAETSFRVLKKLGKQSLVEFQPRTGRTHQIRVHAAALGFPVAGDKIYGDENSAKRLMLHASELKILDYKFESKLPS